MSVLFSALPLGETRAIFYDNIYTGQRPLSLGFPTEHITTNHRQRTLLHQPQPVNSENEGPKWNCHMCTFQNHPLLDRCEQCEMPRILHGKKQDQPLLPRTDYINNFQGLNNNNNNYLPNYAANRQIQTQYSAGHNPYNVGRSNPFVNQYSCPASISLSPRIPNSTSIYSNTPNPTAYLGTPDFLYNPPPGSTSVIPSQVYNPFGYNRNFIPDGGLNSNTSSSSQINASQRL